jgi:hypothetical protein
VGSRRDCTWVLGLPGFRVVTMDEAESGRLVIQIERRGVRRPETLLIRTKDCRPQPSSTSRPSSVNSRLLRCRLNCQFCMSTEGDADLASHGVEMRSDVANDDSGAGSLRVEVDALSSNADLRMPRKHPHSAIGAKK